ncbi:hypothetical protein [Paenibacillus motobuensis]|uniref:Lipoprotein n=1 Tax=Paenibacillus motobuensis TaxID=295324 RepID=A0ABN0YAB0_9BACL
MRNSAIVSTALISFILLMAGCTPSGAGQYSQDPEANLDQTVIVNDQQLPAAAVEEATELAKAYKLAEYEVDYVEDLESGEAYQNILEKIKPYLTDQYFERKVRDRSLLVIISNKQKVSLRPDNLQFDFRNQQEDIVSLNYKVDIIMFNADNKEQDRIPIEGQITVKRVNEQWLIQGDRAYGFDAVKCYVYDCQRVE